jgi:hypothetical protein
MIEVTAGTCETGQRRDNRRNDESKLGIPVQGQALRCNTVFWSNKTSSCIGARLPKPLFVDGPHVRSVQEPHRVSREQLRDYFSPEAGWLVEEINECRCPPRSRSQAQPSKGGRGGEDAPPRVCLPGPASGHPSGLWRRGQDRPWKAPRVCSDFPMKEKPVSFGQDSSRGRSNLGWP